MIDFHTHLLPGLDDGSADIDETALLLEEESHQGVDTVVATPHFYARYSSIGSFLEMRREALEETCRLYETKPRLPALRYGAEVYYFAGIGNADQIPRLCINNTRTLLLEMPFEQWSAAVAGDVKALIEKQRLTVVLAHVERYVGLQKDRGWFDEVFAMPVVPQINAGSFLEERVGIFRRKNPVRQFCLDFLADHPDTILGSDCHNTRARVPNLKAGRSVISECLGEEALRRADEAADRVLQSKAAEI